MTTEPVPCIVSPRCFACRARDRAIRRRAEAEAGSKLYAAQIDADLATAEALVADCHSAMRTSRSRRFPRRR